jgi:microsomal dipeptidase-like Zn-dependent dipeptidase
VKWSGAWKPGTMLVDVAHASARTIGDVLAIT